jgi:hypothetical protein
MLGLLGLGGLDSFLLGRWDLTPNIQLKMLTR